MAVNAPSTPAASPRRALLPARAGRGKPHEKGRSGLGDRHGRELVEIAGQECLSENAANKSCPLRVPKCTASFVCCPESRTNTASTSPGNFGRGSVLVRGVGALVPKTVAEVSGH
jgi:hypothetical protein